MSNDDDGMVLLPVPPPPPPPPGPQTRSLVSKKENSDRIRNSELAAAASTISKSKLRRYHRVRLPGLLLVINSTDDTNTGSLLELKPCIECS